MTRCPACNSRYKGIGKCRRCGTDLEAIADIERRAESHLKQAVSARESNDIESMYFHSQRACSLRKTPESMKIMAYAAIMTNRFNIAVSLWSEIGRDKYPGAPIPPNSQH